MLPGPMSGRLRAAAVAAALLASASPSAAQTPTTGEGALGPAQTAALDAIAETIVARKASPSIVIGVAKAGRMVYLKALGYRNLDDRVPADADTLYGIGSNTKQFTAACILLLRDDRKLDVDAQVARYLPHLPHGKEVTIRQLLTHTGGYAEFTELDDIDRLAARPATSDEILATIAGRPLGFRPGTKWQYSNTGYVILTAVIEKLSGMPYADFLRRRIFEPLGMTRTRYEDQGLVETDRAAGYTRFAMGDQEHEEHLDYSWLSGAGAIASTAGDLERWNEAIDRGALLSPESRTMMHTPMHLADGTDTHYGFGLFLQSLPGNRHLVLHGGDTTGFGTQDARFIEERLDIIVLTNQEPAAYNAIVNAVYAVVGSGEAAASVGPPAPAPADDAVAPAIPYAKASVDALARRWLDDVVAGTIDLTKLRPSFAADVRLPRARTALRNLALYGPRRYTLVSVDRRSPTSTYAYLLQTQKRTLLYVFAVDDDGLIAGADVSDPNPLAP
jgi:CubicO group peptidase (beta-lactamase class C family)